MKKAILFLINLYQSALSPYLGARCRFHPRCSEYAKTAIEKRGIVQGGFKTITRLCKCQPFFAGGVDFLE